MKCSVKTMSAVAALVAAFPIAQAQPGVVSKVNPDPNKGRGASYWTPERFRSARPMPMPVVKPGSDSERKRAPATKPCDRKADSDAYAPPEEPATAVEQLYDPAPDAEKSQRDK